LPATGVDDGAARNPVKLALLSVLLAGAGTGLLARARKLATVPH
jgi:hypothetical protein